RCDRQNISEARHRVADAVEAREWECAERRRECATNRPRQGGVGPAVESNSTHSKLAAKNWRGERIEGHDHTEIRSCIKACAHNRGEIDGDSAYLELARSSDIGSGRHAGVIIERRERPSWLLRSRSKAPEKAGNPEAHAAFVSGCDGRRANERAQNQNKLL